MLGVIPKECRQCLNTVLFNCKRNDQEWLNVLFINFVGWGVQWGARSIDYGCKKSHIYLVNTNSKLVSDHDILETVSEPRS